MSTDISAREFTHSPWSHVIAELVGLSRMVRLGLINPLKLHNYLVPQRQEVVIPKGTEHLVILLPGFSAPGTSMDWMAKRLTHDKVFAMTWGDHANIGPFPHIIDPLFELIKEASEKSGLKVVLVGHSLGGCYALHANHLFPEYVQGAVTLGSPIQTSIEDLAEATVLGHAATLLANEYIQKLLHEGIVSSWAAEHTKSQPEGFRLAVGATFDTIVNVYATLLHDADNTRSAIVKSDHVGLASNELVARMIDAVVRSGDVNVDFGAKVNARLKTIEDLETINGFGSVERILNHMLRNHRYRMKIFERMIDELKTTGLDLISNAPAKAIDTLTNPFFDPFGSVENAKPGRNGCRPSQLPHGVVDLTAHRGQRNGQGNRPAHEPAHVGRAV